MKREEFITLVSGERGKGFIQKYCTPTKNIKFNQRDLQDVQQEIILSLLILPFDLTRDEYFRHSRRVSSKHLRTLTPLREFAFDHSDHEEPLRRLSNDDYDDLWDNFCSYPKRKDYATGKRNAKTKLNPTTIRKIFKLAADGMSHRKIGEKFGVCNHTVSMILLRRIWKQVKIHPYIEAKYKRRRHGRRL